MDNKIKNLFGVLNERFKGRTFDKNVIEQWNGTLVKGADRRMGISKTMEELKVKLNPKNRDIDIDNVCLLVESIAKNGFSPLKTVVTRVDGKLKVELVIDGQHTVLAGWFIETVTGAVIEFSMNHIYSDDAHTAENIDLNMIETNAMGGKRWKFSDNIKNLTTPMSLELKKYRNAYPVIKSISLLANLVSGESTSTSKSNFDRIWKNPRYTPSCFISDRLDLASRIISKSGRSLSDNATSPIIKLTCWADEFEVYSEFIEAAKNYISTLAPKFRLPDVVGCCDVVMNGRENSIQWIGFWVDIVLNHKTRNKKWNAFVECVMSRVVLAYKDVKFHFDTIEETQNTIVC